MANFLSKQQVNFSYFKKDTCIIVSLIPGCKSEMIQECKILSSDSDNTGDRYAMSVSMNFVVHNVSELSSGALAPVSHPKWNIESFFNAYKKKLGLALQVIEPLKLQ